MYCVCDVINVYRNSIRKHPKTHRSQISPVFLLIMGPVPTCRRTLLENSICYRDSDFTIA